MTRTGRVQRQTSESKVHVVVDLDGHNGIVEVGTGVAFFDHMIAQLGKHGGFALTVQTEGDLHIDAHHTIEDTTIALGQAFAQALGDKVGIHRYGDALIPMDEVLVQAAVDLSGRAYCVHVEPEGMTPMIGPDYPTSLTRHVMETFAFNARIALHLRVLSSGRDAHHIVEAQFKALARALRMACALDTRQLGVPSTKGLL
ncbi:MAG: imidazoleglycerol-phosphate dehydratase HisB [Geodermatophilaceae bacterium]